jgi:hypothetical protein
VVALAATVATFSARSSRAQEASVPAELQAELIAKIAPYDRNQKARAGDKARVLLVVKPGDARSALAAAAMRFALSHIDRIGGVPHEEVIVQYEGSTSLAKRCRVERVSIVYITPGFGDHIAELRNSLAGTDVLSVSAVPDDVPKGVVLGFDLVSGKPKLLLNLTPAKEQNVNFKADVLTLMKVYR